jgi:hypothetical protein
MRNSSFLSALLAIVLLVSGCSSTVPAPASLKDAPFPRVRGESLTKQEVILPDRYLGKPTLMLVGYLQKSQFDIDRWILGALQADIPVQIVEVPTIAGMMPQMVQGFINSGMRSGIPESDWASVVTVYEDAPKIIAALGNERPQSAYAVLLSKDGRIVWTSNIGYSAGQILDLKKTVESLPN